MATFFRLLKTDIESKGSRLAEQITALNTGELTTDTFSIHPTAFKITPESPFAYWLSHELLQKLQALPKFEPAAAIVRQGLATGDDFRFVRTVWEINPADLYFCYYPTDGRTYCEFEDPIIQSFFARRNSGKMKWAFHVKAGSSQPWYSPLSVVVDWEDDGYDLKHFYDTDAKLRSRPQNLGYYFRPGFSWTRRAVRFIPYAVPSNAIATVSRYMAYPGEGNEYLTLGIVASNVVSGYMRIYEDMFERPNYLVDKVKSIPWPSNVEQTLSKIHEIVIDKVNQVRKLYEQIEPYQDFVAPLLAFSQDSQLQTLNFDLHSLLSVELENEVARVFGLSTREALELGRDLEEALFVRDRRTKTNGAQFDLDEEEDDSSADSESEAAETSKQTIAQRLLSYCVGVAFGRWDVRLAFDQALVPKSAGPFDSLPTCPVGTLIAPDGLPAQSGTIVSEEWLRARPDRITLPRQEHVKSPIIQDSAYPLTIQWDGILSEEEIHSSDIVRRVRAVLHFLFGEKADTTERNVCETLGVASLRDYFRLPKYFFAFHVDCYSIKKGRRKAPIYWLLQSKNRRYGLWVYYHRLTTDTLYRAAREYVDPKISLEANRLAELEADAAELKGAARKARDREIAAQSDLIAELKTFRKTLDRIALLNLPFDRNDGVILNIAPLHELVPWREARVAWDELMSGKYEWSTIGQHLRARKLVKG